MRLVMAVSARALAHGPKTHEAGTNLYGIGKRLGIRLRAP